MIPEKKRAAYEEFLKISQEKRAEFIDGNIYFLASPSFEHQMTISRLNIEFMRYFEGKECIPVISPFDVIFEDEKTGDIHVVQPDLVVICNKKFITEKGYKGVPKLIVEVLSPSSASVDYIKKMQLYSYFDVCEYWIVNPRNKSVQVFVLDNGVYIEYAALSQKGIVKSAVFENLEFDIENVFNF
ncbi:protein of unknown function DUF820 [Caldicellulosiruptor hydrothermalis 108]|uniref:Putative restriction endonuclease domain-containing protein n=1 Tax=Caldicellulosiruptor hydrothermalis (strain DSM 18901 / VKM B-2411 / 108) TaxID=632292 RepID=E4Q953_CALH1|nr:Uma2 family endonuclease [Caldicellulosiruptor hydrothermalis]ADQ08102.1 protein of unknown function DUF820 [Caldicellulosiruptor hydrothermalis 108]